MNFLLQSSILIAAFYVCYRWFLQKETFFHHSRWFLLLGLIGTIALPFVEIPNYIEYVPQVQPTFYYDLATNFSEENKQSIDIEDLFLSVYLLGTLFFTAKLLIQMLSLKRQLAKSKQHTIKNGYHFIETDENIPPFSFFNRVVLNPSHFSTTELNLVIKHEMAHARGYHSLDILFAHCICIVLWFNPIAWLYKLSIRQNLEYIADHATLQYINCDTTYQTTILKACLQTNQLPITNHFSSSYRCLNFLGKRLGFVKPIYQIKKRIVMLQSSKSNSMHQFKVLVALPLIAIFLMSFSRKDIYVAIETNYGTQIDTTEHWNVLKFTVNKTTSDQQLENIVKRFKAKNVHVDFKNVSRNTNGYITVITIDFKAKNSSGHYNTDNNEPIKDIQLIYDIENENLSIKQIESELSQTIKTGTTRIKIVQDSSIIKKNAGVDNNYQADSDYKSNISDEKSNIISVRDTILNYKDTYTILTKGDSNEPIFILDGKEISNVDMKRINTANIDRVEILKDDRAIKGFGEKGKNGVVMIKTKSQNQTGNTQYILKSSGSKNPSIVQQKPLIVINGNIQNEQDIEDIDPNTIASVSVLKDKNAIIAYGDSGRNGVIEIRTNSKRPRTVNSEVTGLGYLSTNGKHYFEFIINKNTIQGRLDILQREFDLKNLNLKFSKIRRNKKGEITSIKILLNDDNGKKSSIAFKEKEMTIPEIVIGKSGDDLILRSIK